MIRATAAVLATAVAAALVLVQPWVGRRRYQRLLAHLAKEPAARIRHYRRGIIGEWATVGVLLVIGLLAGRTPASVGLTLGPHARTETAIVAEVAVVLGVSALLFRFGGRGIRDILRRQARGFEALLPRGRSEKQVFALLAVTAGVCEEVMFRAFGIAYLHWLWPAASRPAVIVITAAAFGLVHLYQGPRGVVLTGVVGAYLAWLVLTTGSLLPAMAIHALLDLRILALPDLNPPAQPSDVAHAAGDASTTSVATSGATQGI
jgi:membrane protease YdiL (CAAX protease family)